jgi:hypothetical protein
LNTDGTKPEHRLNKFGLDGDGDQMEIRGDGDQMEMERRTLDITSLAKPTPRRWHPALRVLAAATITELSCP